MTTQNRDQGRADDLELTSGGVMTQNREQGRTDDSEKGSVAEL
jgi:hypothetical protein